MVFLRDMTNISHQPYLLPKGEGVLINLQRNFSAHVLFGEFKYQKLANILPLLLRTQILPNKPTQQCLLSCALPLPLEGAHSPPPFNSPDPALSQAPGLALPPMCSSNTLPYCLAEQFSRVLALTASMCPFPPFHSQHVIPRPQKEELCFIQGCLLLTLRA